jgi:hypothetical protein
MIKINGEIVYKRLCWLRVGFSNRINLRKIITKLKLRINCEIVRKKINL